MDLLTAGWAGLCANPAEVMLGPSRARTERLMAIADSLESPQAADLLALARGSWARPGPLGALARILACTWEERVAR